MRAHAAFLVGVPLLPGVGRERLARDVDDLSDAQAILFGEMEVTLVMRRHRHHCAFAITHQHIVADPDLDFFAAQRMFNKNPRRHALFFHRRHVGFGDAALLALVDEGGQRRVVCRSVCGQRMLGRDRTEGHPHDGVGPSGEDKHLAVVDRRAVGVADLVRESEPHAD